MGKYRLAFIWRRPNDFEPVLQQAICEDVPLGAVDLARYQILQHCPGLGGADDSDSELR